MRVMGADSFAAVPLGFLMLDRGVHLVLAGLRATSGAAALDSGLLLGDRGQPRLFFWLSIIGAAAAAGQYDHAFHILGIAGTFMGGVAAIAKAAGFRVTGSDLNVYPPMSTQLQALGIELVQGYGAEQLDLRARHRGGRATR